MKKYKIIIWILSIIIVVLGLLLSLKYWQQDYTWEYLNNKSSTTAFDRSVIKRDLGSNEWPVVKEAGNYKLYIALEDSEDGNTQTLKVQIHNMSKKELSGTITAEFLTSKDNNLENSLNFAGREFSLNTTKDDYYYFEYSVDVSSLTAEEKETTEFMISVCESGGICN